MRFFYIAPSDTSNIDVVFEVVSSWNERLRKLRGIQVGVLIRFAKWRRACTPCRLAEKYNVPLFVDNGAFEYLSATALERQELDSSVIERWIIHYSSWLANWYNYVVAAAMPDIPVHGRKFLDRAVRVRRIETTVLLHERFARILRRIEPAAVEKAIVVLQGYTVDEYEYSLELLSGKHDLLGDTQSFSGRGPYSGIFGVGSVCVRKPSARGKTGVLADGAAAGTLHSFMNEFLNHEWPGLVRGFHFFGLHTEAVRRYGMHRLYYASDTGAHGLNYRYKWRTRLGCRSPDTECYARSIESQLRTTLGPLAYPQLSVVG